MDNTKAQDYSKISCTKHFTLNNFTFLKSRNLETLVFFFKSDQTNLSDKKSKTSRSAVFSYARRNVFGFLIIYNFLIPFEKKIRHNYFFLNFFKLIVLSIFNNSQKLILKFFKTFLDENYHMDSTNAQGYSKISHTKHSMHKRNTFQKIVFS